MHFEFLKLRGFCLYRRDTADQASDPIGSLKGLISVTFGLKRRLYYSISRRARIKHYPCRLIDKLRSLRMFIHDNQNVTMLADWAGTMLIKPFDRLAKNG